MTERPSSKRIIIVGAGLAGSLMACYLAEQGYEIAVYERRSDPRRKGYIGGRSINLALSARGIKGLAGVGSGKLADAVLKDAIPMRGRMMHSPTGATAFQYYSKNHTDAINSISRGGLNLTLINAAAKYPNVKLYFDHRCLDVDLDAPAAVFEHELDDESTPPASDGAPRKRRVQVVRAEADLVIGTDGAFSPVRGKMQKLDRFQYSQSYLEHGYKELHIPPRESADPKQRFALDPNALHIWPRGGSMMIALPNPDGSFTCTLFWPFEGRHSFGALKTNEQIERFFNEQYPDAVPLMPTLVQDFQNNPTSSLVTVRCWPWAVNSKVVILGDAAHAIVPFFGQGMNCAFEDCLCLAEQLKAHPNDFAKALSAFQELRKENADAIADMALANFIEMRDKVASRWFRLKKKLAHAMHAVFPKAMIPLYDMVSFSTIPYADAKRFAERRSRIITLSIAWIVTVVSAIVLGIVVSRFRAA